MTRALSFIVLMTFVTSAAGAAAPAQSPAPQASALQAQAAPQTPAAPAAAAPDDKTQAVVTPQGFTYTPEGRRDPFISLMRRGTEVARETSTLRPSGLLGLATGEVTLSGIMASRGGYVAMLEGVDKKTYIVRSGDKLLDGTVRAITADTMVIMQQVNDPLSLEKQREVRKVLRQEEAN